MISFLLVRINEVTRRYNNMIKGNTAKMLSFALSSAACVDVIYFVVVPRSYVVLSWSLSDVACQLLTVDFCRHPSVWMEPML